MHHIVNSDLLSKGSINVVLVVKNQPANAGNARDAGSIPELGRSPGERNGNPLPYSCLGKFPQTEEPGGLHSRGLQSVRNNGVQLHS